jgi:PEGA domain-containing protein
MPIPRSGSIDGGPPRRKARKRLGVVDAMRACGLVIAICAAGTASLSAARADARDAAEPHDPREAREVGWVVVGGGADEHDRAVVAAAVTAVTREVGWSPPRDPIAAQDSDRLLDCSDPVRPFACVPPAITGGGVRRIFVLAVEHKQADSGAPMVVLTARLLVASPPALVVRQRFCEHCADDRLAAASAELARQLLQDLAVRNGRTILEVASAPPGARITLDGKPIGATNATFNTYPGAHVVVVEKAGYRPETRTVVAGEGKTAAVSVALSPADPAAPRARSSRRVISGALIGGGALAVVAGGVLLDLGARGGTQDRYRYPGATPAGAAIGLAGAAAVATGLYLWWRTPASSAPAIAISSGGVVAGWAMAF